MTGKDNDNVVNMFARKDIPAEHEADLRGLSKNDALAKLTEALDTCRIMDLRALLVKFDPATPTSGETLFQPVGQALREAREDGYVDYCMPISDKDCGGFLVVLTSNHKPQKH